MLAAALQVSICKDVCKMFAKTVEPLVSTPSTVCLYCRILSTCLSDVHILANINIHKILGAGHGNRN